MPRGDKSLLPLLLLIRDLRLKLGAVVLTGDSNKGAERERPPGGSESQRRISPLEATFQLGACSLAHVGGYGTVGSWR